MKETDIAIVGMAGYFPKARTVEQYWDNLVNGVDCITDVPPERIDPIFFQEEKGGAVDRFYCKRGGFCYNVYLDPTKYGFLPIAAQGMDPEHMLVQKVVHEALEDAKVFEKNISLQNCCAILGKGNFSSLSALRNIEIINTAMQIQEVVKNAIPNITDEELDKIKKTYQASRGRFQADNAIALMPNLIASFVTNKLDMHGPAYTVDGACASSIIAINQAIELLLNGQCDIALAGGIHAGQTPMFWSSFTVLGALSRKGVISPFSEDADGLLIGEGGGVLVLKKLKKAIQDEDRIYAVIKATSIYSDGSGVSVMAPNTKGQQKALELAWKRAGMDPKHIGLIEAHGTGTIAGDKVEINTLNEFFGTDKSLSKAWLGSVKSNIGHIMPAAGMAGVMKMALSLYNRQIPATLHAERPAKALEDSRFQLPQTLTEWDESKYPLIAGVNAFGFGGINSHAILTAYEKKVKPTTRKLVPAKPEERLIIVADESKEALLKKLEIKDYTVSEGDYRLVLFNPTEERVSKAKSIIEKDKPWKGRLDIWFSNAPLLKEDGKLAFVFPGFSPDVDSDIDTITKFFDIRKPEDLTDHKQFNQVLMLYQKSKVINKALGELGVVPDMNAGHSVGEWHAAQAGGLISDDSVESMFKSWLDPSATEGEYYDGTKIGVFFVAVGCGYETLKPMIEGIQDLYLSNDNCPNQIIMCGKRQAVDAMVKILKEKQIYNQELPFTSGYHTPFIAKHLGDMDKALEHISIRTPKIPVWSATSLETYPTGMDEFRDLTISHLTSHIRFRELIDKLYEQENARVFVQIGSGMLTGFVDDILKGKEYSVIPTNSPQHSGLDQLRRVLALLFIEGKDVDKNFMNIIAGEKKITSRDIQLQDHLEMVRDFPLIREALKKHGGCGMDMPLFEESPDRPMLEVMNESMREMTSVQSEMVGLYREMEKLEQQFNINPVSIKRELSEKKEKKQISAAKTKPQISAAAPTRKGTAFTEKIKFSLETQPYLKDHSIVKQPPHWTHIEDQNSVVPMTLTTEIMAEFGQKQDPSKKVISVGPLSVYQWMHVKGNFEEAVKGYWKEEDLVHLEVEGYASADVRLGDEFPEVPAEYAGDIDLGEDIVPLPTQKELYEDIMFHGPAYQGVTEVKNVTKKGIRAMVKKAEGKGSLLDAFGQTLGTYLHITTTVNPVTFPVKINELTFYQDFRDQEGVFENTVLLSEIGDDFIMGDIIMKRDGKVWCIAKTWYNRRFEMNNRLWNIVNKPLENLMARKIDDHVFYYDHEYDRTATWGFLEFRYLNYIEKEGYNKMFLNKKKEYLISRIVLKDVIRNYGLEKFGKNVFPVEIVVKHDENGRPYVEAPNEYKKIYISLSHKPKEAVAIASDKPVGIDIEVIENRTPDFMEISFNPKELEMLRGKDEAEWGTRFWTAKEAYSKMIGVGLKGNPKQYEVEKIEGETLYINGTAIKTVRHKDNFIVGWTL